MHVGKSRRADIRCRQAWIVNGNSHMVSDYRGTQMARSGGIFGTRLGEAIYDAFTIAQLVGQSDIRMTA